MSVSAAARRQPGRKVRAIGRTDALRLGHDRVPAHGVAARASQGAQADRVGARLALVAWLAGTHDVSLLLRGLWPVGEAILLELGARFGCPGRRTTKTA